MLAYADVSVEAGEVVARKERDVGHHIRAVHSKLGAIRSAVLDAVIYSRQISSVGVGDG